MGICLETIPEATQKLLTMLWLQVLSCLLATQFVDSKPQLQYWPQLYQPYHYTQYTLPIYSQNYLREAAVTGHFPGSNQKVTPYWNAINFDSPRYFKAFCDAKIAQNEWDCTATDLHGSSCNPNVYDQTLINDMVGNNGDSMLSFAEYRNVMQFYKNVAQQQGSWTQYC